LHSYWDTIHLVRSKKTYKEKERITKTGIAHLFLGMERSRGRSRVVKEYRMSLLSEPAISYAVRRGRNIARQRGYELTVETRRKGRVA
jgi:hypothetical protein